MNLQPKKSLGQHFLNSKHVLEQIIEAARIQKVEPVLEIGPGTGILTDALLNAGAYVLAVEKDDRSIGLLKEKFAAEISDGRLNLIHGDILEPALDLSGILRTPSSKFQAPTASELPPSFALIANIPYYITGAILEKFLEYAPRPNRMLLLVQKEVARRILGSLPGGEGKESILSVSVKAFGQPKIIATVPPGAFTPPPTVDSAILSIENISADRFNVHEDNRAEIQRFFEIVKAGFAHKRKFLIRNLETIIDPDHLKNIWLALALNEKARAEDLTVEEWVQISRS